MALAPRRDLLGVPSREISIRSSAAWLAASWPWTAVAISPLTFSTALLTPLPIQSDPPSRNSVASNSPVDAPEGTAARPQAPERRLSSTSTVGLPRLSRIWRAWTCSIWLMWGDGLLGSGSPERSRRAALQPGDRPSFRPRMPRARLPPSLGPGIGQTPPVGRAPDRP